MSNDLMRKARLAAMLEEAGEAPPPASPKPGNPEDALVSEGTKAALKNAGALAGMAGKWGLSKAKQAAVATAEKTKQAKDAATQKLEAVQRARVEATPAPAVEAEEAVIPNDDGSGLLVSDGMAIPLPDEFLAEADKAPIEGVRPEELEVVDEAQAGAFESGEHDERSHLARLEPGLEVQEVALSVSPHQVEDDKTMTAPMSASAVLADPEFDPPLEDPLGEPAPLPDDAYSEDISQPTTGSDNRATPRMTWPWVVAGVVVLSLVGYAVFGPDDDQPSPSTAPTPTEATPPAVVEAPVVAPVAEPLVDVETVPAVEPEGAEKVMPKEPAAPPAVVVQEPEPVAVPAPTRAEQAVVAPAARRVEPKPVARPTPRPAQRAPAAAPVKAEPQWQDKATQDMDRWAQDMGIE